MKTLDETLNDFGISKETTDWYGQIVSASKMYARECVKASLEKAAENAKALEFIDNPDRILYVDKSSITSESNIVLI